MWLSRFSTLSVLLSGAVDVGGPHLRRRADPYSVAVGTRFVADALVTTKS
jgi:hypothetical protein